MNGFFKKYKIHLNIIWIFLILYILYRNYESIIRGENLRKLIGIPLLLFSVYSIFNELKNRKKTTNQDKP